MVQRHTIWSSVKLRLVSISLTGIMQTGIIDMQYNTTI